MTRPAADTLLDLHGLADFHGVHYDTARKGWQGWVRTRGHPAPCNGAGARSPRWRLAALQAWRLRAEAEAAQALIAPASADNDNPPAPGRPASPRRVHAVRAMAARI